MAGIRPQYRQYFLLYDSTLNKFTQYEKHHAQLHPAH